VGPPTADEAGMQNVEEPSLSLPNPGTALEPKAPTRTHEVAQIMEMNDAGLAAKARDTRQNDVPNVRTSNTIYRSVVTGKRARWQKIGGLGN